jgi:hypothetical protein
MLKKIAAAICFTAISLNAAMFAGITDKGFDFGAGSGAVDFVFQGEFTYIAADSNFTAWTLSLSPNIEYCLVSMPRFKLYGMSGPFIIIGHASAPYLNIGAFGDINNENQEKIAGFNILVLRPEAILSRTVSIYADIPILQWERGTQAGNSLWLINGNANGSGLGSAASLGIKFYF